MPDFEELTIELLVEHAGHPFALTTASGSIRVILDRESETIAAVSTPHSYLESASPFPEMVDTDRVGGIRLPMRVGEYFAIDRVDQHREWARHREILHLYPCTAVDDGGRFTRFGRIERITLEDPTVHPPTDVFSESGNLIACHHDFEHADEDSRPDCDCRETAVESFDASCESGWMGFLTRSGTRWYVKTGPAQIAVRKSAHAQHAELYQGVRWRDPLIAPGKRAYIDSRGGEWRQSSLIIHCFTASIDEVAELGVPGALL